MERCDFTEALRSRKVLDEEVKNSEAGKKLYPAKNKETMYRRERKKRTGRRKKKGRKGRE